ncbi:hypothetical protein INT47_012005, partial [Mucor saturninus]
MKISGLSIVQLTLASIVLLPNSILTQTAEENAIFSRYYFSPVVKDGIVYIFGGSNQTLDVPFLNIVNGLEDTNNPSWTWWSAPKDDKLRPFDRGVAYLGANDEIFVQAGGLSTTTLESLVNFKTNGQWVNATTVGSRPSTSLMTATVNPSTGIAYYYGGQPLTDHRVDIKKHALSSFYSFDTYSSRWTALNPTAPAAVRPGRNSHTSNIINNQMFIMGGLTDGANDTVRTVQADFESVLVYDIITNNAISVTTLGDIPGARQGYSTALGLDGHSIVIYGGYIFDGTANFNPASNEVYVLDTCTLTWRKQEVSGTSPGTLYAHSAINVNDYMILLMGKVSDAEFNDHIYILDMKQWKWVTSFTATADTIPGSECRFELPNVNSTNFVPYSYDFGVIANPLTPSGKKKVNGKGFGIGFGIVGVLLVAGGVYYYMRRVRNKKSRALNPRWMRTIPTQKDSSYSNDRDYPLFVYNKELDNDNNNNPNAPRKNSGAFAPNGVRTYTASDHEQWEQQLNQEAENPDNTARRHSDIWSRMRGLNDASVISDEEVQHNRNPNHTS